MPGTDANGPSAHVPIEQHNDAMANPEVRDPGKPAGRIGAGPGTGTGTGRGTGPGMGTGACALAGAAERGGGGGGGGDERSAGGTTGAAAGVAAANTGRFKGRGGGGGAAPTVGMTNGCWQVGQAIWRPDHESSQAMCWPQPEQAILMSFMGGMPMV
ncbi:MAG: hypothetical protein QOF48_2479 [Verrucomicrobiota bacterium]|jgi:hypothetical protein